MPTDKTEEVRRLGMGPLLADLGHKMQDKVDKGARDPLKLLIHSAHDTSIGALCATLDVPDEKYVPGRAFLLLTDCKMFYIDGRRSHLQLRLNFSNTSHQSRRAVNHSCLFSKLTSLQLSTVEFFVIPGCHGGVTDHTFFSCSHALSE